MHVIISYRDGRRVEAIALAAGADRMRISVPGCDDAVALSQTQSGWITETGEAVELEAMIPAEGLSERFAEMRPRSYAAGDHSVS